VARPDTAKSRKCHIITVNITMSISISISFINTPCPEKKGTNSILGITSSNTGRFSKFFQCYNLLEICNKTLLNFPPHLKCVATLPCEKLM